MQFCYFFCQNCHCESTDTQTDTPTHTHTHTHTHRDHTSDLIICPMLCYSNGTDNIKIVREKPHWNENSPLIQCYATAYTVMCNNAKQLLLLLSWNSAKWKATSRMKPWAAIHEQRSYRSRIVVVNLRYDQRPSYDTLYSRNTSYRTEVVRLS